MYCSRELEALKEVHNPDKGIVVLAVNNGEAAARVEAAAHDRGYRFPVLLDQGAVHRAYGVIFRPATVIVGPDGKVAAYRVGAHSADAMRAVLREHGLLAP